MAHATVLYLGTEQGLWTLGSAGGSWRLIPRRLADGAVTDVLLHPTQLLTIYAAAEAKSGESGLYRSESGGADWQLVQPGTATAATLVVDEVKKRRTRAREDEADQAEDQPFTLLFATEPAQLYRSDDGGQNWQPLIALTMLAGQDEAISALMGSDRSRIYAGLADGRLFYSADGGATWLQRAQLEGYIYCLFNHAGGIYTVTSAGILRSSDGGDTWHDRSGDFIASGGLTAFAPVGDDAGVLLAHGRSAEGSGVFRSTDGGTSWQRCEGLDNNEDFIEVQVHPTVRGAAYAVSLHHAYASEDRGSTWDRIEAPAIETINALAVAKI
jgi:BNR/Asp-box repeat